MTTDDRVHLKYNGSLNVSPTEPFAALVTNNGARVTVVPARGAVSAPLTIPLNAQLHEKAFWSSLLPGTSLLRGFIAGVSDGKGTRRDVVLDVTTGAVRAATPKEAERVSPSWPPLFATKLSYTVAYGAGSLTQGDTAVRLTPIWMQSTDPAQSARGLIAADSDIEQRPVSLASAVLYARQGTLFAVPLATLPLDQFLARRQEVFKEDTLLRARSIGYAASSLSHDAREPLPRLVTSPAQRTR